MNSLSLFYISVNNSVNKRNRMNKIKIILINHSFQKEYYYRRWQIFARDHKDVEIYLLTPTKADWYATKEYTFSGAETVYGILTDGTYFVYYPEMDLVETYDCEPDELIDILYASEDEMPDEARTEAYNDFFEQHNVNTYTEGPLFDKLHKLYFEDEDLLDESKKVEKKQPMSSNIEKMVSRVEALEKEYDKSNRDMTEKELCADVKKIIEEIYGVKIPDIKLRTILQNGLGYRFKISQNINKYLNHL